MSPTRICCRAVVQQPNVQLVARDLGKTYGRGDTAVHPWKSLDLEIWPGEFVVMLRPFGSGKSTLFNILGGLDTQTSGGRPGGTTN